MEKIIQMKYINQSNRWPTGCESVSSVMVLNDLGIDIDVDSFIERYIECVPFESRDGVTWGANPYEAFAGSPYDPDSFGCYAPVILKAMNQVFEDTKSMYRAFDETGTPIEVLIQKYIMEEAIPVVFWACIDMKPPIYGPQWRLLNDGTDFAWISNEHCLVLVGEDQSKYYFYDPWDNHGLIGWDKELVSSRHIAQRSMAIGIRKIK